MKNVVFVSGNYGSGKSTLCRNYSLKTKWKHITASSLITKTVGERYEESKSVKDISLNQDKLISEISALPPGDYLLDGHTVILNSNKQPECISVDVFSKIGIQAIILVRTDEDKILQRIRERESFNYSVKEVKLINDLEYKMAKEISEGLDIPLKIIDSSINQFDKSLKEIEEFL
mgnify:CR=1 FL=1